MISRSKLALIDADLLVYRIGFTTENADEGIAAWRLDELIQRITDQVGAIQYRCYITSADKSNFRYAMFPEYKAHRKQPKPKHYGFLRDRLLDKYMAIEVFGQEADDALAQDMLEKENGFDKILVTIDKDLDQIPGWHFNFVTDRMYNISELEGWRSFYYQCLVGDKSTDNIEGCPKIGVVKANRMLEGCQSESEMFETVLKQYQKAYPHDFAERLLLAGNLLWMRRVPGAGWTRPDIGVVSKESLERSWQQMELPLSMNHLNLNSLYQNE